MISVAVVVCTDCRQPVESADLVLRMISSSLDPAPFHETCYRLHIPAPRERDDERTER